MDADTLRTAADVCAINAGTEVTEFRSVDEHKAEFQVRGLDGWHTVHMTPSAAGGFEVTCSLDD